VKISRCWFCERKEELRREFGVFWGNLERATCFLEVVEIGYHDEDFYENLRNLFKFRNYKKNPNFFVNILKLSLKMRKINEKFQKKNMNEKFMKNNKKTLKF
jgi:hypothetical protein